MTEKINNVNKARKLIKEYCIVVEDEFYKMEIHDIGYYDYVFGVCQALDIDIEITDRDADTANLIVIFKNIKQEYEYAACQCLREFDNDTIDCMIDDDGAAFDQNGPGYNIYNIYKNNLIAKEILTEEKESSNGLIFGVFIWDMFLKYQKHEYRHTDIGQKINERKNWFLNGTKIVDLRIINFIRNNGRWNEESESYIIDSNIMFIFFNDMVQNITTMEQHDIKETEKHYIAMIGYLYQLCMSYPFKLIMTRKHKRDDNMIKTVYVDIEQSNGATETTLVAKIVNKKIVVEIKDENSNAQHNLADVDIHEDGNELYRIQKIEE